MSRDGYADGIRWLSLADTLDALLILLFAIGSIVVAILVRVVALVVVLVVVEC